MGEPERLHRLRGRIELLLEQTETLSDEKLMALIEDIVVQDVDPEPLTANQMVSAVRWLFHSFRGLDVLQPLVDDASISEIMVNRHDEIYIEREGKTSRFEGAFESQSKLEDIIQAIVSKVNRVVNEFSPIVDARLPDGSRVHVVLPPVALKGPTLTIRKFPETPFSMEDLIAKGTLPKEAASLLGCLIRAKYNLFISGGTGSGKTTFLNALTAYIPEDERIVTIEDSAELRIPTIPNLVSLETRNANTEGKGSITMRELIRASLRMRPNRIMVGEVRGAEALDMLQAMNTGHEGSLSTGHANSTADMLSRLETMTLSGSELPLPVVRKQIASALELIVQLSRMKDRSRKVVEIAEVVGMKEGDYVLNPLYVWKEEADDQGSGLVPTGNRLVHTEKLERAGIRITEGGAVHASA
ncbi:hypothetical protein J31TS4_05820 [Paenibacillus sp. J31TS4]|uniref:CpaF family protein n=1 Tax=Paenibacillus sp. J31TS4 TaxID=2807195 RepID=UPI001B25C5B1|nr:CpaF family protein [Paenibacillus sp. J31TS4]GIP37302.1 hypothetical protein J31TS4_05820 [Paenibacillus sp. J31TS4]